MDGLYNDRALHAQVSTILTAGAYMFVVFHLTAIHQRLVPLNTLLFFSALLK